MSRITDVDLRLLRVFTTIVECGGFAGAQTELNVGMSTISTHMSTLEARLGVRLCQRGRVGFSLTDKGRVIYEAAKQLFAALDDFRATAGAQRGQLTGNLNLGIVDSIVTNPDVRLQDVIRRFNEREHDVHINLVIDARQELERAVLDGRLHAAIGPFERRITGLEYTRLCTEEHAVYCGRGHPFYDRPDADITMADIAESSFVARGYMDRADLERLDIRKHGATVFNMEAQAILILSGGYIGFLPAHFAERWMATAELRQIRRHELGYRSQFYLIARRGAPETMVIRTFLADLRAELALEGKDAPANAALASVAMAQILSSRPKPSTGAS